MRVGRVLYPTQAREWLFPADSARGHIVEHKEDRATLAKWDNDLRQTYRTIAQTVGIGDLDIHLLMNHTVAGVNAGYITRSKLLSDHLRQQQEMISRKMIDVVRGRVKREEQRAMTWPLLPARTLLKNVLRQVEDGSPEKQALTVGATRRPQRPTAARRRDAPKLGPVPRLSCPCAKFHLAQRPIAGIAVQVRVFLDPSPKFPVRSKRISARRK
jgi:hypothetical protein